MPPGISRGPGGCAERPGEPGGHAAPDGVGGVTTQWISDGEYRFEYAVNCNKNGGCSAAAELFNLIGELNRDGLSMLLVEQNTNMALQSAHRGYVLELGRTVLEGTPAQLAEEEQKLEAAYLGAA